ncbi:hypothetical protein AVEN_158983-1 [Araneus ventricosus]|uniref:Uncharacterized protein n=1 Tax=Araneus ventricosus TaxID=182803 RepID=A0A4Y2BBP9_ARAVE|nr:hypothetical protein AVEN_158983-1 [Araneus ventricosus]
MRSVGADIQLSSPDLESSISEVSPTTPLSDKELPPVFPAPTGEVEPTPRPVEPKPSAAMIPEQRSEPTTVHPNTAESVPNTLGGSTRVRKPHDRLILRLFLNLCSINCFFSKGRNVTSLLIFMLISTTLTVSLTACKSI